MEIEDFDDEDIKSEFFERGLNFELDTDDISDSLIDEILEMRDSDMETLTQQMLYEKMVDYISNAGPLDLIKLEEFIDNENTTHIRHTR